MSSVSSTSLPSAAIAYSLDKKVNGKDANALSLAKHLALSIASSRTRAGHSNASPLRTQMPSTSPNVSPSPPVLALVQAVLTRLPYMSSNNPPGRQHGVRCY
jgi:hypothetical protein